MDSEDVILNYIEREQQGEIIPDSYWDQAGTSSVRSSSDSDPTKYYDPAVAYKEHDQRSVASLLPSSGPRGVIIPRASRFGKSMGFDPHKPRIVNIDPDIAGQSSVVDLSKINSDQVNEVVASTGHITDPRLAASIAFRKLANVGVGPDVNSDTANTALPIDNHKTEPLRPHPLGLRNAYVVPKALPGGGQAGMTVTPAAQFYKPQTQTVANQQFPTPLEKKGTNVNSPQSAQFNSNDGMMSELEALQLENQLLRQQALARIPPEPSPAQQSLPSNFLFNNARAGGQVMAKQTAVQPTAQPEETVTYAIDGFGDIRSKYKRVIKSDFSLVLVSDALQTGDRATPSQSEKPLIVDVASHNCVYKVVVPGIKFRIDNYDICVLFIVDEAPKS